MLRSNHGIFASVLTFSAPTPEFVSRTAKGQLGGSNLVINVPAHSEGDVLVAFVGNKNTTIPGTLAGWGRVRAISNGNNGAMATYVRTATASEPGSYTFPVVNTASVGHMLSYTNAVVPIISSIGAPNTAGVTSTKTASIWLSGHFSQANTFPGTKPSNMTLVGVITGGTAAMSVAHGNVTYDTGQTASGNWSGASWPITSHVLIQGST